MRYKNTICLGILAVTGVTHAAEETELGVWTGDAELGYVATTGNTETTTANANLDFTQEQVKWRNNLRLEALNTSEDEVTSAERYLAAWKTDYKVTDLNFLFATAQYEDDRFSGYDYQATAALGYGRTVISNPAHKLNLEIGPGFRHSELETGGSEDEAIVKLAAKYRWVLSETAKFSQDLVADVGEESTVTKSISALSAKLNGRLAMKVSYTVKHESEVPAGSDKTNTETSVALAFSFL